MPKYNTVLGQIVGGGLHITDKVFVKECKDKLAPLVYKAFKEMNSKIISNYRKSLRACKYHLFSSGFAYQGSGSLCCYLLMAKILRMRSIS